MEVAATRSVEVAARAEWEASVEAEAGRLLEQKGGSVEDFMASHNCRLASQPEELAAANAHAGTTWRGSGAIGPYPYAAGLFWGMSYELVQWIAGSRLAYDFAHNASTRFAPPYWVKGEDSAFGFFAHLAPFPELTPIHWGWDILHDGCVWRPAMGPSRLGTPREVGHRHSYS